MLQIYNFFLVLVCEFSYIAMENPYLCCFSFQKVCEIRFCSLPLPKQTDLLKMRIPTFLILLFAFFLSVSAQQSVAFSKHHSSGYVPVSGGGRLYYEIDGAGEPVLLLHGHTLDRRMWDPQMPALVGLYQVIRPDLRGYGLSSKQADDLQFTHTDDVITLLDSLHIDKVHIVGLSMGSFIASEVVALHPDRLLTATLASGNIRNRPGPSTPFSAEEIAKSDAEIAAIKAQGVDNWKREWIDKLVGGGGSQAEQIRESVTQQVMEWDSWQLLHRECRAYYANEAMDTLKATCPTVPVLILSGENEHKSPRNPMLKYMPNGRQEVIPDCGHMSNMERPEQFNALLLEQLKRK